MIHPEQSQLHDYADGLLASPGREGLAAHVAQCPACRHYVQSIQSLSRDLAALPERVAPRRDLGPELRQRIAAESSSSTSALHASKRGMAPVAARSRRPVRSQTWFRAAVLAGITVAAGTGAWLGLRSQYVKGPDSVTTAYARASDDLTAVLRERESDLNPAARHSLDIGLAAVDAAIGELERAREEAPSDRAVNSHLESRYRTKLELLRSAMKLLEET